MHNYNTNIFTVNFVIFYEKTKNTICFRLETLTIVCSIITTILLFFFNLFKLNSFLTKDFIIDNINIKLRAYNLFKK